MAYWALVFHLDALLTETILYLSKLGGWAVFVCGFVEVIVITLCVVGGCLEGHKMARDRTTTKQLRTSSIGGVRKGPHQ